MPKICTVLSVGVDRGKEHISGLRSALSGSQDVLRKQPISATSTSLGTWDGRTNRNGTVQLTSSCTLIHFHAVCVRTGAGLFHRASSQRDDENEGV